MFHFRKPELIGSGIIERHEVTREEMKKMFPKPKRYENEEYLEFIRGLDCCVPGCSSKNVVRKGKYTKVEAHHTKTVASGGSDLTAIPLHDIHHTEAHTSQVKFQEKYGVDFKEVQIECLQKFIEEKCAE